ncbi:hypothetical protein UlMin_024908 [Ulmus minor]
MRFWWGSSDNNPNPLCLKPWNDICVPKGDGGLDFRRMDDMNQAMLSKWGWDLLTGKSSLCLSFLLAKHLRNSDFISAKPSPLDSPFWRAIMRSKDLLFQGVCRQIGDRFSINIWEEP